MGILRNLCRSEGITVVASLHDVDVAAKVSDRVALVKSGSVVDWGLPESVLKSSTVAGLYDFDGADFDHHLGSIELRGNGKSGRAFVLAGMGSGALIYRMLSKRGFRIATGVLHTNDLDCYVARSLGAECTCQEAMQAIDHPALIEADGRLDSCDVVIDCGFPVGPMNQGNVQLLHAALRKGKMVLSLRQNGRDVQLPPQADGQLVRCDNVAQLLTALDDRFPGVSEEQSHETERLAAM
jgi:iron complex transport system ATP-binding protein